MRSSFLLLLPILLAACREQPGAGSGGEAVPAPPHPAGLYRSGEKDALCLKADGTAGFITYADGRDGANCSVRGRLQDGVIVPLGDESCRIGLARRGTGLVLGEGGPSCAYYCGPNASFANKEFTKQGDGGRAVDLAGDPLC